MPERRDVPSERLQQRVAEALGIDVERARALPDFDPCAEVLTAATPRPLKRCKYVKAAVVDAELAPFLADARAGIPDAVLARRTGLRVSQIRKSRRRHDVRGRRGRTPTNLRTGYLAEHYIGRDVGAMQHVTTSEVDGRWRAPEYVLREPLDYSKFAELVHWAVGTYSTAEIASAIGIAERDVIAAVVLHDARGAA